MEAGVLLIDKRQHNSGILAAVKLLDPIHGVRDKVQEHILGDKELYWIGLAIMSTRQIVFADNYKTGAVGVRVKNALNGNTDKVCSTQAFHLDELGGICMILTYI